MNTYSNGDLPVWNMSAINDADNRNMASSSFSCSEIIVETTEDTTSNKDLNVSISTSQMEEEVVNKSKLKSDDYSKSVNCTIELINCVVKHDYDLKQVFKDCPKSVVKNIFMCNFDNDNWHLKYDIYCEILTTLIRRWDYWNTVYTGQAEMDLELFKNFYFFLRANIHFVISECKNDITKMVNKHEMENVIHIASTLKNLKSIFYYEPQKHEHFYSKNFQLNQEYTNFRYDSENSILNHPFVTVNLNLPGFSMLHRNMNYDKYDLVNLQEQNILPDIIPQQTQLRYEPPLNISSCRFKCVKTVFIHKFLEQLKCFLMNDKDTPNHIKNNICYVLSEFQKDIELCEDDIKINTYYHMNLVKYPYIRYMGRPTEGNMLKIFMEDQLRLDNDTLNIRLQQISYPMLSFNLLNFDPKYNNPNNTDEVEYIFDKQFLAAFKNKGIMYECTLCNKKAKFNEMRFHLGILHGIDPDWGCTYCYKTFNTKYLSLNRWQHECQASEA